MPGTVAMPFAPRLSQLRQAAAERDRLERVLVTLARELGQRTQGLSLEALVDAACDLCAARMAAFLPVDRSLEEVVRGGEDERSQMRMLDRAGVFAPALAGRVVELGDALGCYGLEEAFDSVQPSARPLRSWIVHPVGVSGEELFGILVLAHYRVRAFSARRISLGEAIAKLAAHELGAARAAAEQARISNALQTSLLPPSLPRLEGIELAACYRPSGYGNLVGGDFYDVFPNKVGGWDVLLGDVSGIGPEAAGLAGVVRYTARALSESTSATAQEIVTELNTAVLHAASLGRFCSAVLARLTRRSQGVLVELASAGHPSPFVLKANGEVVRANSMTGTILGVVEHAPVGSECLVLQPGDALACYTDGVLEARGEARDQFGTERAIAALEAARGRSAAGIARRLERAVLDHRGPASSDDVAIVVARATSGST